MSWPKLVLAVIDPTASRQPALQHAAVLAKRAGARLEIFVCAHDPQLETQLGDAQALGKARTALVDEHLRQLRALAKPLAAEGIETFVDVRWQAPLHEGIVRKAVECGADVVVKDTHYHSAPRRTFFSNTDWELIRSCPMPLWLVKPRPIADRPRIVAAVDPTHPRDKAAELDHAIVTIAGDLAAALGGELHAFHAFSLAGALASATSGAELPVPEVVEILEQDDAAAVQALVDAHAIPHDRVHAFEGDALSTLTALTEQLGADVVVMGAVSRSRLARLVIGNTADDLLARIGCDVLIVKPPALRAELSHAA
jgi:universal stress protein E